MTEPVDDEVDVIYRYLEAERVGPQQRRLAHHHKALLRKAAILMASDDAGTARDLVALLDAAPRIISPGAKPAPRLQDLERGAEWDLERLSAEQLVDLEAIAATATGAACPLPSPRMEAALALVSHLDHAVPEVGYVRSLVADVLRGAFTLNDLNPSFAAELNAERAHRAALEEEVRRLQRALERAAQPLPAS
jgi:hypothetical protein